MPAPKPKRPRLPRELFETRTHAWTSLGLGDEIESRGVSKRSLVGFVVALAALIATLVVYSHRRQVAPGYGQWFQVGTVIVLIIVGTAAIHWLSSSLQPRLYRRLDPATAGTAGFVFRLLATLAVVVLALRIAGVTAATLAVGGAFTAVLIGLAAQQSLGAIFAGIVLQSTRPFRVGERVRLVGGALAGSLEGTVTSLGLFYTTFSQGADRMLIPNNMLLNLAVVPLREPEKVDVKVRFPRHASPARSSSSCCGRSPCRPATDRASRSRRSNPTASCCGSRRRRCAPRTGPSSPTRCWRRCAATTPPTRKRPGSRRSAIRTRSPAGSPG
jgi:small conductance mechanosensitive channel